MSKVKKTTQSRFIFYLLSINPSIHPSIHASMHLSIIYLSICHLSIWSSIHSSIIYFICRDYNQKWKNKNAPS
jgi:hypothetical protein